MSKTIGNLPGSWIAFDQREKLCPWQRIIKMVKQAMGMKYLNAPGLNIPTDMVLDNSRLVRKLSWCSS